MYFLSSQVSREMSFLFLYPVLVLSGCFILLVIAVNSAPGPLKPKTIHDLMVMICTTRV